MYHLSVPSHDENLWSLQYRRANVWFTYARDKKEVLETIREISSFLSMYETRIIRAGEEMVTVLAAVSFSDPL